ncbi:RraA family protein [Sporosarcina sp. 179-K 8C2 HS]|uniref:RraA family protein n=1 Tax=Sporosarcina sp. 179-K 8C2 HS TaxID=3142387 RepID=UPI0039A1FA64
MIYTKEIIAQFKRISTASISDAIDQVVGKQGFMDFEIKPRINDCRIVGPAVTVSEVATDEKLPPEHALDAIDSSPAGSVIVIGLEGSSKNVACWGGLMTAGSVARDLEGAVLDAAVRDVTEIKRDFNFPVFSRSVAPVTTVGRYKTEALNVPVECGGITVHPGDLIVGDQDGIVVVPSKSVLDVLKVALEIEEREVEQTMLILSEKSLRKGIEKYNRI